MQHFKSLLNLNQGSIWVSAIIVGCFLNNVVLEMIIRYSIENFWFSINLNRLDRGAGGLLTFFQFLFVALIQLPSHISFKDSSEKGWKIRLKHSVPFKDYIIMTILFFLLSVANNKSFVLGINQPFNVIFRSLSLLISFLIGRFSFNKEYVENDFLNILKAFTKKLH